MKNRFPGGWWKGVFALVFMLLFGTAGVLPAQASAPAHGTGGGSLLVGIDWIVLAIFFICVVAIGVAAAKTAGKNTSEFFLGGRGMPWWLLGISMVACTFSCDTPNLVTDFVRTNGVAGNWNWWAFLITGMVTVFIYAQLWRRSRVMTDLEYYELRYSGKSAAFIRGFRALYLGVFFNCLIMGSVTLAAIKIGQIIFDLDPYRTVILASLGVVIYATAGGIKGCIWADFFQYSIAMFGAVYAAVVAVSQPEVGGLSALLHKFSTDPALKGTLQWMPDFNHWLEWVPLLLIPVAVQWWAVWYPGAEPGGGGYIAQRMLAAKDEKNAVGATLFFNFMHYAMRPWPWIIVALASMICFPTLASLKAAFPGIDPTYLKQDIAYPAMIARLGPGFLGLVVASLIAAYMSTIGTHLNWGSSYAVNDFYQRFVRKNASQKELVLVGRIMTILLMVIAGFIALTFLQNAQQAFKVLLLSGAGTGLIYLLRWFWWRINAWTEIVAMFGATAIACVLVFAVGNQGILKMYVGTSLVSDQVHAVVDPQAAEVVQAERKAAAAKEAELAAELDVLVKKWKEARDVSPKARDEARKAYDAKHEELEAFHSSHTVAALALAMKNKPWVPAAEKFKKAHSSLGGVVKGGTIYFYDTAIEKLISPIQLLIAVILVTILWVLTTFLTPPVDKETLRRFYKLCHPGGPGWKKVVLEARAEGVEIDQRNAVGDWKLPWQVLCVFLGCVTIYTSLFAVGSFVYGSVLQGVIFTAAAVVATVLLFGTIGKIGIERAAEKEAQAG